MWQCLIESNQITSNRIPDTAADEFVGGESVKARNHSDQSNRIIDSPIQPRFCVYSNIAGQ